MVYVDYYHVEEHKLFIEQVTRLVADDKSIFIVHENHPAGNKSIKFSSLINRSRGFVFRNMIVLVFEISQIIKNKRTVFLGSSLALLFFLPVLPRRITVMLHGEISLLNRKNFVSRCLRYSLSNSRCKLVSIARHIQVNLLEEGISCDYLDIPIKTNKRAKSEQGAFILGLIGTIDDRKYIENYLNYFECIDVREIVVCGKTNRNTALKLGVEYTDWLSQDEYENRLNRIDLAFFPYGDAYRYIRSGAIDECLEVGIIVITTCHYLWETYGDKILYVRNKEEFNDLIKRI
jgi:hypothetical protein